MPKAPRAQEPSAKSRAWTSARDSANYQAVQAALVGLGFSADTLDSLAFSLGLLPDLFLHGRVLARARVLLDSPVFDQAQAWGRGDWPGRVRSWKQMLGSWDDVRETLRGRDSFLDPPIKADFSGRQRHPMRRHGMEVAPLVTTLVVTHAYANSSSEQKRQVAARFDHLAAMLLAAAIQFRWSGDATVADYLRWVPDNKSEFAPFPIASDAACRAVRWLSERPQAALVAELPTATSPIEFARAMLAWEAEVLPSEPAPEDESEEERRARTYPSSLANYFWHWKRVLQDRAGTAREPATISGGERSGGGSGVEGHILADQAAGQAGDANSNGVAPNRRDREALESRGLAPEDLDIPRLPLEGVDQINGALSGQKWRAMRAAMADTVTPADIRYLTAGDAGRLAKSALEAAGHALADARHDPADALPALLCLLVLALGQPPEAVAKTKLLFVVETRDQPLPRRAASWSRHDCVTIAEALELQIDGPVLLAWPPARVSDSPPWLDNEDDQPVGPPPLADPGARLPLPLQALAFMAPAVTPRLAGEGPGDESPGNARQTVRNLLLPAGLVGSLLVTWWQRTPWVPRVVDARPLEGQESASMPSETGPASSTPGVPLFPALLAGTATRHSANSGSSNGRDAAALILDFLSSEAGCPCPPGFEGWSVRLLQQHLAVHMEAATGDRTLAWLATCQADAAGQARLYYTQHSIDRLATAWDQGMRAAGLGVLLHPSDDVVRSTEAVDSPLHWPWSAVLVHRARVGAPFVAEVDDVRQLIGLLQRRLQAPVAVDRRSALREHHRDLLLLSVLYQGLCTGLRAIRSPVALLRALEQSDRVRHLAGLPMSDSVVAGLADKESYYNQRARLVPVHPGLLQQLRILQSHQAALMQRLNRVEAWLAAPDRVRAMFRLDPEDRPLEVTVAWVEKELASLGCPRRSNFDPPCRLNFDPGLVAEIA